MGDLKAIGSEKLQGQEKIKRIMEIARYGETTKNETNHISTNHYSKKAANGVLYSIIKEKDGYYVKSGLNESSLDYVNGLLNKSKNRYRSYSAALKRLNLMLKPINEQYNNGFGDSLYEQSDEEEKFVLKTPESEDDVEMGDEMDVDVDVDMGDMGDMEDDMDVDMEDDMDVDMEDDMDVDMDIDMGGDTEKTPSIKSIQKLTGKLGQKMREFEDDIDSDMIKYILNSIISAVDLEQLDDEDREDIVDRLDPSEDEDYGMEDEFDVDMDDDMEDMDMDIEDMEDDTEDMEVEFDIEDETDTLEESLKRRVNNTLTSYYKDSASEIRVNENNVKNYLKKTINNTRRKNSLINLCETMEQELILKKVLNHNKTFNFRNKTKRGTIVLENKKQTLGINRYGKILS